MLVSAFSVSFKAAAVSSFVNFESNRLKLNRLNLVSNVSTKFYAIKLLDILKTQTDN